MPTKPTVLVTASTFPRWEGDSEPKFVFDLCTRLTEKFNVIVVAPHAKGAALHEKRNGLSVFRYRYAPSVLETIAYEGGITANLKSKRWKYLLLPTFFFAQWFIIKKLLKQHPISIIHAHWLIPQGVIAALATSFTPSKPALICTSHGGDLFGLQDRLSMYLKSWVIRRSQHITVVSSPMRKLILDLGGETPPPIHIIPMGTDLQNTFIPNPATKRSTNQLLFVGRLVEKKGVEYLLRALKKVHASFPDTQLVIAGSGPLQKILANLATTLGIKDSVNFTGRLEHKSLVHLYQESTLAVFPFIQAKNGDMEGLGLVMLEAMGCGCPVIASDLPAVKDVIQHNNNGYLVASGNPDLLASEIQMLLINPDKRASLSAQGLRTTQHSFDWTSIAQRYQTLLHDTTPNQQKTKASHAS